MNILFLIFHGFSETSGISQKILYQIKGMRESGHKVDVCTYIVDKTGYCLRMINEEIIKNYGTGLSGAIRRRIEFDSVYQYALSHQIDLMYVRSMHNANPFTIHLFKSLRQKGIKIALEIPTYPYDNEYKGFPLLTRLGLQTDKLFRYQLAKQANVIVTFSNEKNIFGQCTIRISNGVDFDNIKLRSKIQNPSDEIHFIGVAEVHYWHGYDRLIAGLGEYYRESRKKTIYFHIIGGIGPSEMYDSQHAPGFHELIEKYNIEKYIIFHGPRYGKELDDLFNHADIAIGSLARHRSGIEYIKTLKNREYAARGIPFIYSETDSDFDNMPYILKVPANEDAIDIEKVIFFYENNHFIPHDIRNSILHLSWKEQMNIVIKQITGS